MRILAVVLLMVGAASALPAMYDSVSIDVANIQAAGVRKVAEEFQAALETDWARQDGELTPNDAFYKFRALVLHSYYCALPEHDCRLPQPATFDESKRGAPILSPVVIVHGDGGCQLEAKLDKATSPNRWCAKKRDWFTLWVEYLHAIPGVSIPCLVEDMTLTMDPVSFRTTNFPGVDIRVKDFGDPLTVEYIIDSAVPNPKATRVFNDMDDDLVTTMGYQRGVDLLAAQYDFRKSFNELKDTYHKDLQLMIEDVYKKTGNKKVTLVAHSYGNPQTHYFLTRFVTAEWKAKYIRRWISVAPAQSGAAQAVRVMLAGENPGIPGLDPLMLRTALRSFTSTTYLFPNPKVWNPSALLVDTPSRKYYAKASDYKALFDRISLPQYYDFYEHISGYDDPTEAPGVEVHCMYGDGMPTIQGVRYSKDSDFPDKPDLVESADGDGTVPGVSLRTCHQWQGKQSQTVKTYRYYQAGHVGILHDGRFRGDVLDIMKTE